MKKSVTLFALTTLALSIWATDVPTLLIQTTSSGELQIPIASIQKITYNEAGTTMYVYTTVSTPYQVSDIVSMTLSNVPVATALTSLPASPTPQLTKIVKDGVVYVVGDGQIYTLKGDKL